MNSGIPEKGAVPEEGDFDVDDSMSDRDERDGEHAGSNGTKQVANADAPSAPRKSNRQREAERRVQRLENKKLKKRAQNQQKRPFRKAKLMNKRRKLSDFIEPAFADEAGLRQHLSVDGWQGTPFGGTLVHEPDALRRIPFEDRPLVVATPEGPDGQREVVVARSSTPPTDILEAFERVSKKMEQLRESVSQAFDAYVGSFGVHCPEPECPEVRPSNLDLAQARLVEWFLADPDLAILNKHVESFTRVWFPNVCKGLVESNKKAEPQLQNRFGLFPLLTVNLPDEQQSAFTQPRRDWKSPASSICVMIAGGNFESITQHHLVLDELGLALEVPKGVAVAFPAALLTHYEHSFTAPRSNDTHTSMVWSAQADLLAHRELGDPKEAAKARGVDTEDRLVHTIFRLAI
ncbi:hypothetical protein JCM8202_002249 [Rhodotorula sphaerocarpa]